MLLNFVLALRRQAVGCGLVGSVTNFQSKDVFLALKASPGRAVIVGSSGPASINKTFQSGLSLSLLANTGPATPAPTIIKSNLNVTNETQMAITTTEYIIMIQYT